MRREVVVDTETTGLDPFSGHRIVEVGCVELVNHVPSGRTFHVYVDPERDVPIEAFRVHGLSREFLTGKPRFHEIVDELNEFLGDDPLVMHNASFDVAFINAELERCSRSAIPSARAIDTLDLARRRFPGAQASLDALCRRFGIDLSEREQHGALLDARLLSNVYLELIGGREPALMFREAVNAALDALTWAAQPRPEALPARLSAEERARHTEFIRAFPAAPLWTKLQA